MCEKTHLFLKVFDSIGHTSKYLQSSNLDLLAVWLMVENTVDEIGKINFDTIVIEAEKFSQNMNDKFTNFELNDSIIVEDKLPLIRSRHKKRNYDEMCSDESIINPIDKFRVQIFQCTIDQLRTSFIKRFSSNKEIIADIQYLLPKNFQLAKDNNLPESALKKLSKLSLINHQKLVSELNHFSKIYNNIAKPLSSNTSKMYNDDDTFQDNQECDYDNFTLDWDKIDSEVKIGFVLTLSVTQVNCERAFSKLKIIKNRLRSSLNQDHLEAFMLMSIKRDILDAIDFQEILNIIKKFSSLMNQMLSV
ncbi:uncharacterized protein LOC112591970 [Melanaphis sacchari]|uniref:uncharacterized protein LOC112591970 n=1 Tax=Melanaphis sacchari TaxID=742174 RepID=UPI000DC13D2F|nr:uncharacterized protein LOC112591970 [Melanaphis sacchari]